MQEIQLKDIAYDPQVTPELQEKIDEIAFSIQEHGLLHPISVQKLNGSDLAYELITGKKRLLAHLKIGRASILCKVFDGLDVFQKKEVALHENLKRGQLPWYEEVMLVKELHELRQQQHGTVPAGRPEGDKKSGWGMRDTALELGKALGGVSMDMQLATLIQMNPALKNIKDKTTAMKVVKQTSKRIFAEEEATVSGDVDFADEVYFGDASSILAQFPETAFDFCITDPPWIEFGKSDDVTLKRDAETLPVFKALYRVMKYDSIMYLFCGIDDFVFYQHKLVNIGWKVQKHPCIWAKGNFMSRTGVKAWEHGRDLEMILVAAKGSPVIASSTQVSALFTHDIVPSRLMVHPHEKPVELIQDIMRYCSYEGSLGIDPFGGSGVFGSACVKDKRHYVIIEREYERYQQILTRLKKKAKAK